MQKTAPPGSVGRALAVGVAVAGLSAAGAEAGRLDSPGCLDGGEPAVVAAVDEAADLHLADGRTVHLAGIRVVPETGRPASGAVRDGLVRWLVEATVRVAPLRSEPDRWGRTVALVFAPAEAATDRGVSVGEALLEAGAATAEPASALSACWPVYLRLEQGARAARAGAWAGAQAVLDPSDRDGLRRALGTWTLVEGTVGSVHDGRARTYVRFRDGGGGGFALAVDLATARTLSRTLGPASAWVGRRILARGLLDDRWGLQIDVASPEQIAVLPP